VAVQQSVTVVITDVGAGRGVAVKVEPGGQLTGISGQLITGHSGLPGGTQNSGHGWNVNDVVVAYESQVACGARGAGVTRGAGLARTLAAMAVKKPREEETEDTKCRDSTTMRADTARTAGASAQGE